MEKSLKLHHHLNENPNADLPDVQAQYWEDGDLLDVHTGDTTGDVRNHRPRHVHLPEQGR